MVGFKHVNVDVSEFDSLSDFAVYAQISQSSGRFN